MLKYNGSEQQLQLRPSCLHPFPHLRFRAIFVRFLDCTIAHRATELFFVRTQIDLSPGNHDKLDHSMMLI